MFFARSSVIYWFFEKNYSTENLSDQLLYKKNSIRVFNKTYWVFNLRFWKYRIPLHIMSKKKKKIINVTEILITLGRNSKKMLEKFWENSWEMTEDLEKSEKNVENVFVKYFVQIFLRFLLRFRKTFEEILGKFRRNIVTGQNQMQPLPQI